MGAQTLLPCSQEPGTGSYNNPDESGSYSHTLFILDQFNIVLLSTPLPKYFI